jgi:hypothetical protein
MKSIYYQPRGISLALLSLHTLICGHTFAISRLPYYFADEALRKLGKEVSWLLKLLLDHHKFNNNFKSYINFRRTWDVIYHHSPNNIKNKI